VGRRYFESLAKSQEQVMGWFGGRLIASLAVALIDFY